jgi:glycine hydroxymethyltransferase
MEFKYLSAQDSEILGSIKEELLRERNTLELIASENFVSPAVLETASCVMTNKYAEGYPNK